MVSGQIFIFIPGNVLAVDIKNVYQLVWIQATFREQEVLQLSRLQIMTITMI